jgi:hypothetical protein
MKMANLMNWLKDAFGDEQIEAITIGEAPSRIRYSEDYTGKKIHGYENKLLSLEEASYYLDYDFHDGFGAEDCHAITAWSATKIAFVVCYDGSTWLQTLPRNPTQFFPPYVGGG